MRKVFCGDGAWLAVPYLINPEGFSLKSFLHCPAGVRGELQFETWVQSESECSVECQRVKTQRVKTSENFAEEKNVRRRDISEDFSEDRRYHFYTGFYGISGYLRNLRGRLLSSEKFSEVFTLGVFTLKPFPGLLCRV